MVRKTMMLGTLAAFGLAAAIVGAGDAGIAFACDKEAKSAAASSSDCSKHATTASATAASTAMPSCCAKGASKTTTAGSVHQAMIRSAVVAPGAAPALNIAAFAAGVSGSTVTAAGASCCDSKSAGATAGACDKSAVHTAAGSSCGAAAKTAGAAGSCERAIKTAAASVDEVPYRESKRVVLTGNYECGHCGIGATAECTPMFKTADGKVYRLWDSPRVSELRSDKTAKNVEIATVVKKVDGVKYLDVKSYKTL